jgi:hypothetical protein
MLGSHSYFHGKSFTDSATLCGVDFPCRTRGKLMAGIKQALHISILHIFERKSILRILGHIHMFSLNFVMASFVTNLSTIRL